MPAQRLLMLSLLLSLSPGVKAQTDPLVQVLQHRHCPQCRLSDADLVHAQLNDANLRERSCNAPTSARPGLMGRT